MNTAVHRSLNNFGDLTPYLTYGLGGRQDFVFFVRPNSLFILSFLVDFAKSTNYEGRMGGGGGRAPPRNAQELFR